ncbi:MAG TPA: hypothetical protein EYO33_30340 [Phycisphaerales bacterium]|nr:hypothetical protein [Phycisphaerales bacterium]
MRRVIKSIGVAGSAAALDTIVEVYVGNQSIGRFFNSATGAVQVDSGMFPMNAPVGPGAKVVARVTDAPASNPINIVVDFAP